jgi:hypothetical protein
LRFVSKDPGSMPSKLEMKPMLATIMAGALATGCQSSAGPPPPSASAGIPNGLAQVPAVAALVHEYHGELFDTDRQNLALGRACGIAPSPPPAAQGVSFLLAARRSDLLADAARRAPTPEGRLWGTVGLVRAGQLKIEDLERAAAVTFTPVWSCDGCTAERVSATTAVKALGLSPPPAEPPPTAPL